jgi:hypothetical protein
VKITQIHDSTYDDLYPIVYPILNSNLDNPDDGHQGNKDAYPYDDPFAAILNPNLDHENLYSVNPDDGYSDHGYPDKIYPHKAYPDTECLNPHNDPYSKEGSLNPSYRGG